MPSDTKSPGNSVDAAQFKSLMSRWGSGVTVITMKSGDVVHGMTASAFCSVSLDPALLLVCVGKKQNSHKLMKDAGRFVVNFLAEDQHTLSDYFAKPRPEGKAQFDAVPHRLSDQGEPYITGALAHCECTVWSVADGGDHDVFIGQIQKIEVNERVENPLIYFKGKYRKLGAT
jgi:flavin reductase (DIM6/NTAB) family NADH-FMN oxidoreductase RutF